MNPILEKTANFIHLEQLREIALLMYRIGCVKIDQALWTAYLRSGTGQFKFLSTQKDSEQQQQTTTTTTSATDRPSIWPETVKTKMIAQGHTTVTDTKQITDDACLDYVQRVLQKFQNQIGVYQNQLKQQKKHLGNGWTNEIERAVIKFVQQYCILFYQIPTEQEISSVEYSYVDRLIQMKYDLENPNYYQRELFTSLTRSKFKKEQTKMDVAVLKQRLLHNYLPTLFDSLDISSALSIHTIQEEVTRQRVRNRYEKVLQHTNSEMMLIAMAVAEARMNEAQKKFDRERSTMKEDQQSSATYKKLTPTMFYLLERRFQNNNQRLMRIYKLKLHFFVNAPTIER